MNSCKLLQGGKLNFAFHFLSAPSPSIEGPGFLRGRGGVLKGRFYGGNCVGTSDHLLKSEGNVCQHFDFLFSGGQKFTFPRG